MTLQIIAYGRPAPQGSKRHVGNGVMVESSQAVKPWRDDVKAAAEQAIAAGWNEPPRGYPIDTAVVVRMVFSLARPKSHYRTGRNAHLLAVSAPVRPKGVPDLSKLVRSTEDALTAAGLWRDDALVVEYARLAKVWCDEDPESLDRPGVRISVLTAAAAGIRIPDVSPDSPAGGAADRRRPPRPGGAS